MWRPWKSQTDKFLAILLRSGLLDETGIQEATERFRSCLTGNNKLDQLCSYMVANSSITQWQCDKLREGKFKGFFLDNFKIIGHICIDKSTSTYLAEDIESGTKVGLRVGVPVRGQAIQYEIVEVTAD